MDKIISNSFNRNILNKIRNKYILKLIFEHLNQRIFLEIIKYNKMIQKRLDININNYKEYLQTEIEVFPKRIKSINYFINIPEKESKKYFHIYFNDNNKKEIKRNYFTNKEEITKIKIIIDYEIKSFNRLFEEYKCIEKINFIKFNRKDIKDMSFMFFNCSSLKELNISCLKTNNVKNMSYMFFNCSSLKELNISHFDFHNVNNMEYMFLGCSDELLMDIKNKNPNIKAQILKII